MNILDIRNWSIRNKILIVCICCILIPMAITASLFYNKANSIITDEVSNYMLQTLNQVMENSEKSIKDAEKISMSPYSNMQVLNVMERKKDLENGVQLLNDRQTMTNFLSGVLNIKGDFSGVCIFTEKNENYSITSMNPGFNFKSQEWYKLLSEKNREWVILGPHYPVERFLQGEQVISFIRTIRKFSGSNNVIGYFSIDINYNAIKNVCDKNRYGKRSQLYVLDENSNIVYSSDKSKLGEKFINPYIKSGTSNGMIEDSDGGKKLISSVKSSYTNWQYMCIVPTSELTSSTSSIISYTIIVGLICVLIALAVSILLSFAVTRPLKELTSLMRRVENGDLDVIYSYRSKDEIGVLSKGFNNMIANMNDLIKRVLDFRLKTKEAELEALQSKINPHFLYNTLQSIQMKAVVDGNTDLSDMIELLGNYMRFSISSMKEIIPLSTELEYLNNYINLQKIRFGEKLKFIIETDDKALKCKILKLLLQPLVENAIYHGLEKKQGEWMLNVKCEVINDRLHIKVIDNGAGLSEDSLDRLREYIFTPGKKEGSMGIKNVYERLSIVFEDEFDMKIDSIENIGTKIQISIPAVLGEELNIFKINKDKNLNKI